MKKALIILVLFALYTAVVCNVPIITEWDRATIIFLQNHFHLSNDFASILASKKLMNIMLYPPIAIFAIYFLIKKLYPHIAIIIASPFLAYWFNIMFKNIIARERPPLELQLGEHSISYSYVSNHTILMMCLWGMIIFYTNKYCENKAIKNIIISLSVLIIIISGLSRIWLGVHNPTDVIGAYILGYFFIIIYIIIANVISKRLEK